MEEDGAKDRVPIMKGSGPDLLLSQVASFPFPIKMGEKNNLFQDNSKEWVKSAMTQGLLTL